MTLGGGGGVGGQILCSYYILGVNYLVLFDNLGSGSTSEPEEANISSSTCQKGSYYCNMVYHIATHFRHAQGHH